MKLREIIQNVQVLDTNADLDMEIAGVSYDSRQTQPGGGGGSGLLLAHLVEALGVHAAGLARHVHAHEGHRRAALVLGRVLHGRRLGADEMGCRHVGIAE